MNTTEKRKLEGVIVSKLSEQREAYKTRRSRERAALIDKLQENPPKEVERLAAKRVEVEAAYKKQVEEIERKAEALGYNVDLDYSGDRRIRLHSVYDEGARTYAAPELKKHIAETTATIAKLDDMSTTYTVTIWSESEDMGKLLEKFQKEVKQLVV